MSFRSDVSFPEPTTFNGPDTRPMDTANEVNEAIRDQDWAWLEAECRDFKAKYGAAALLRCISYALDEKP